MTVRSAPDVARLSPYRNVRLEGRYDAAHEVLLYGRSLDGRPGHDVVTPLLLADHSAVLVIRGWVPFRIAAAPVTQAAPTSDTVTVEGFVVRGEEGGSRPDARRIVRTLDIDGIAASLPYRVASVAVQLRTQRPPQPDLPLPVPPPELSEGPHLSYAIQWFSFAAIALVGAAVLLRRERRAATAAP
jgi:cytochrome oxidase assembly protein ShyY1